MHAGSLLGAFLVLAATAFAPLATASADAFLDQPVPRQMLPPPPKFEVEGADTSRLVSYESYAARIKNLQQIIPRPILLPAGLVDFVTEKSRGTDWEKGKSFFIGERNGQSLHPREDLRSLVNLSTRELGLSWKFDPNRGVIQTAFAWQRDDPRSGRELLAALVATPRTKATIPSVVDAWQQAFNALLSKPENFPRVWPLRFVADDRLFFHIPPSSENNFVAGNLTDDAGARHFLVVNSQAEMCNPGPQGSFSYYLFDLTGRFEQGGIVTIGYRCFSDSAWIEPDGRSLHFQTYNNGSQKRDSVFVLGKGGLTRKSFLMDGAPPTDWQLSGLDSGESIFTVGPK